MTKGKQDLIVDADNGQGPKIVKSGRPQSNTQTNFITTDLS